MSSNDKMGIGDSVSAVLGKLTGKHTTRTLSERKSFRDRVAASIQNPFSTRMVEEKQRIRVNVHAVLTGPDGVIKHDEWGENLVTDYGDDMIATRIFDDTVDIVTGMKLGTGATAAAKAGAGGDIVTYISGSQEALDATATDSDKGAGLGHRAEFVCTWIAGDVTNAAIAEVVLTNQTALADNAGAIGDKVARYVFGATIDKQAGDSLAVTWQIDVLGA